MLREYRNRVRVTAKVGVHATGRLIIRAESLPSLDNIYPAWILRDTEGRFILQFLSDTDAAACAAYLLTVIGGACVESDSGVTADPGMDKEMSPGGARSGVE